MTPPSLRLSRAEHPMIPRRVLHCQSPGMRVRHGVRHGHGVRVTVSDRIVMMAARGLTPPGRVCVCVCRGVRVCVRVRRVRVQRVSR